MAMRSILRSMALILFLSPAAVAGAGCAGTADAAADMALPPREEEELGDKVEKQYREENDVELYEGQQVTDYLQRLGRRAVEVAGSRSPTAIEYEFKVIDAPETVNAFAMPGGQIYFYSGLLLRAESEAEVMSVMCHEVAHVTERHIAQSLVARYGVSVLVGAALGENPGVVQQLVAGLAANGAMLKFGRTHEKEADRVGVRYLLRADYDPRGFIEFFERMQSVPRPLSYLSNHPHPERRIELVRQQIADRSVDGARVGVGAHEEVVEALCSEDSVRGLDACSE